jgi:hypothetical protein
MEDWSDRKLTIIGCIVDVIILAGLVAVVSSRS